MANYDNTNKGVIFRNENKQSDKAPEYRGTINVEGKDYEIALWVKKSKEGKSFFSTAQKLKEPKQVTAESVKASQPSTYNEDLPF